MKWSKRAFDIFWSGLGLIFLWPILVLVALLIKMGDRGDILFRQIRVGYHGKPFHINKFRTMKQSTENMARQITVGNDPRITRIGYWLRKFKLDELPQLINVFKGEMSLVGPRPEVERYVRLYDMNQKSVLNLVPGITDPASIKYRSESEILSNSDDPEGMYIQEIMPDKIRINLEYAKTATVWTDFIMILRTIFGVPTFNLHNLSNPEPAHHSTESTEHTENGLPANFL